MRPYAITRDELSDLIDKARQGSAEHDFDDGTTLRVTVETDHDTNLDDFDCYGTFADANASHWRGFKNVQRPEGFDGNAEKLWYGNDGPWWWQPSPDGPKRGTPEFARERDHIRELLAFGFVGVIVALRETCDCCDHAHETESDSLWGIDSLDDDYGIDIVADMLPSCVTLID